MWQLEEVNKVGLNVIQKGSEGYIGEVLHYSHTGKEREKCYSKNMQPIDQLVSNKRRTNVAYGKVAAKPGLKTSKSNSGCLFSSSAIHLR